jgi:hypothetical protein
MDAGSKIDEIMVEKKNLLMAVQALLDREAELLTLCQRQVGNAAFFFGIPEQGRADAHAGLEAFLARSQEHSRTLKNLIDNIRADGRDVY